MVQSSPLQEKSFLYRAILNIGHISGTTLRARWESASPHHLVYPSKLDANTHRIEGNEMRRG